jgi:predicted signal transduction protein with EAL and GGDEF domain
MTVVGHRVVPSASIGISVSTPGATAATLLRDTDAALFRAKDEGRSRWRFFDDAMHAEALERLVIEDALREALQDDLLVAHYQPIVTLAEERVAGHEALVRWNHPTRGLLAPGAFLAVAEKSGLIVPLGQRMLDQVCAELGTTPGLRGPISVNVSAVQLARPEWAASFIDTVRRHAIDPTSLVVEVTETAVLSLPDSTRADLAAVRALGVGLHVDDFGTGYSSISLLRDLPVTGLKLDRSFVAALTAAPSDANTLAAGLASLAAGLGLLGIAEGVETREQARLLGRLGWTHAQGYLFGRPGPALG